MPAIIVLSFALPALGWIMYCTLVIFAGTLGRDD